MSNSKKCKKCGGEWQDDAAGGLCPRCLMAVNFASRTMSEDERPNLVVSLSAEEMREHFPQFEILECLGRGGMGVVYKARQKALDRMVAIKVLAGERQGDADFARRFEREAKILAQMSHANIVTVHDFGEADGLYYIVMEYVDGVNLRDLLRDGKMDPEQALAIVPPICEALEYAHDKGVVHRDIKPENLLLDRDGRVKIADFGIASLVGAAGEKSGTPPYMAPEQEQGVVDRRADIYALGAVLYEMLTGERLDKDLVAPSKRVEIDVRLDEIVLRALEKEPERRYQTANEFRTMVETLRMPSASAGEGRDKIKGGQAAVRAEEPPSARFSRTAIIGAALAPLFFIALAPKFIGYSVRAGHLLMFTLLPLGLTAPFGTTLLGWIAVTQIRRSAGRLYGLGLAVFDGLLFPLLALNALIGWFWVSFLRELAQAGGPRLSWASWLLLTIITSVAVDLLIVLWTWRAVNRRAGRAGASRNTPDTVLYDPPEKPSSPQIPKDLRQLTGARSAAGIEIKGSEIKPLVRRRKSAAILASLGVFLAALSVLVAAILSWSVAFNGVSPEDPQVHLIATMALLFTALALAIGLLIRTTSGGRKTVIAGGVSLTVWAVIFLTGALLPSGNQDFGPTVERIVLDDRAGRDWCLDLDSGMLHTPPMDEGGNAPDNMWTWARETGIDISGIKASTGMLYGVDLQAAVLESTSWDSVKREELVDKLLQQEDDLPRKTHWDGTVSVQLVGRNGVDPLLYAFRTREGRLGILEILDTVIDPGGLRIRYKLVAENAVPLAHDVPRVVRTMPAAFANDVDPSLDSIMVTFDQPMLDKSWSFTAGDQAFSNRTGAIFPQRNGGIFYDAARTTCTMPVKLEPGKVYWVGVNSPQHQNFKSESGRPARPSQILFATRSAEGTPTPLPDELVRRATQINAGDSILPAIDDSVAVRRQRLMGTWYGQYVDGNYLPEERYCTWEFRDDGQSVYTLGAYGPDGKIDPTTGSSMICGYKLEEDRLVLMIPGEKTRYCPFEIRGDTVYISVDEPNDFVFTRQPRPEEYVQARRSAQNLMEERRDEEFPAQAVARVKVEQQQKTVAPYVGIWSVDQHTLIVQETGVAVLYYANGERNSQNGLFEETDGQYILHVGGDRSEVSIDGDTMKIYKHDEEGDKRELQGIATRLRYDPKFIGSWKSVEFTVNVKEKFSMIQLDLKADATFVLAAEGADAGPLVEGIYRTSDSEIKLTTPDAGISFIKSARYDNGTIRLAIGDGTAILRKGDTGSGH